MATYTFETITAAQALTWQGADDLIVSNPTSTGAAFRVSYVTDPGSATTPAGVNVVLTDTVTGTSKTFGPGFTDETVSFASTSSNLYVSNTTADAFAASGQHTGAFLGAGDDTISGTTSADYFQGNAGNDSITDGVGAGNDTLYGGQGNDTILLSSTGHDFVNGNLGDDTITASGAGSHTLLGGQGADSITGGAGGDHLSGDLGNDTVVGGGGNDTIHGGAGNDTLTLSFGAATTDDSQVFGDDGNDTITLTASSHVGLTSAIEVNGNAGNDTITGHDDGKTNYRGGAGDDSITFDGAGAKYVSGDLGNDTIAATATANDTILGGDGNDTVTLVGGANSSSIDMGAGNDLITVTSGTGNDTLLGGLGDDTINASGHSAGNLSIDGGAGNDLITAGAGGDTVIGGDGADTIVAGTAKDILFGGAGNDLFDFSSNPSTYAIGTQDQIKDWASTDHLHFSAAANVTNYVENTATDYAAATAYANTQFGANHLVAVQVGTDVVVFADVDHSGTLNAGDSAVVLVGRSLTDIDSSNIV